MAEQRGDGKVTHYWHSKDVLVSWVPSVYCGRQQGLSHPDYTKLIIHSCFFFYESSLTDIYYILGTSDKKCPQRAQGIIGGRKTQTITTQCSRFKEQRCVSSIMKVQSRCNCTVSEGAKEVDGQGKHNVSFKTNHTF